MESVSLSQLRARHSSSKMPASLGAVNKGSLRVSPTVHDKSQIHMNQHLQNLYSSQILCDLVIIVGDKRYNIHKVALTSHSEKYLALFAQPESEQPQKAEVHLEGVSEDAVEQVLEYLYTVHIDIRDELMNSIMSICSQLDLRGLREKCIQRMSKFDTKNVLTFLGICRSHGLLQLASKMQEFAAEKIGVLSHHPDFVKLSFGDAFGILSSKRAHLSTKSEGRLLRLGLRWLKATVDFANDKIPVVPERLPLAFRIFECIALDQISATDLARYVAVAPEVLSVSKCATILRKAFCYHAIQRSGAEPSRGPNVSALEGLSRRVPPLLQAEEETNDCILILGGICFKSDFPEPSEAAVLKYAFGVSDDWTVATPLPTGRYGHQAVLVNGDVFIIGGFVGTPKTIIAKPANSVLHYNKSSAKWHSMAPMRTARAHFGLTDSRDGHIYVFGGEGENLIPTTSCECYSIEEDLWLPIPPLSVGRSGPSACLHKNSIYLVGGKIEGEVALGLVECYDLEEKKWKSKTPLTVGMCHGVLEDVEGVMIHLGGCRIARHANKYEAESKKSDPIATACSRLSSTAAILQYEDTKDEWKEVASLPTPCQQMAAATFGSKIYVIGGYSTPTWEYNTSIACYDAKAGKVESSALPCLPFGLSDLGALALSFPFNKR